MKRFYKIAGNAGSKPSRLLASVVLSFMVMLFINGFIGSMGGFPAFIAFLLVFFRLRSLVGEGSCITHQLAMTSRREVVSLLVGYSLGYLLLWGIFRILLMLSRVTGWGNINGASALEFVDGLFKTSMLEKSAYVFAGILMFAFVLSLFPLVVIRERERWIFYVLIDAACFVLVCVGLSGACKAFAGQQRGKSASCLIDNLLLCGKLETRQELLALALLVIFTILTGVFVFCFAVRVYGPKAGRVDQEAIDRVRRLPGAEGKSGKKRLLNLLAAGGGLAAILLVVGTIFLMPEDTENGYVKVAQFLTEDKELGPMEYGGRIYVPVDVSVDFTQKGVPQGYLAEKDEDCSSRFYRMAVANLLYTDVHNGSDYVQMKGIDERIYALAEKIEQNNSWEDNEIFLLWDEDWSSESAYSHEPTGYTTCNADLIQGLKMQFPDVKYRVQDFEDYDAYFTIRAYLSIDDMTENDAVSGEWVGCILVRDEKFYFGSYDNQITGICLQQLRDVLGGN